METEILKLYENSLFRTIKQLGDKSKRPYLILNKSLQIVECNEHFTDLTHFYIEDVSLKHIHHLWLYEQEPLKIIVLEEHLKKGISVKEELQHKRKMNALFYADVECLPFQDDENGTAFTLVFISDITSTKISDFLNQLQKDVFQAIQQDMPFGEKLQIVCQSFDQLMKHRGLTTIMIKKTDGWEVTRSTAIFNHAQTEQITDGDYIAYYERCLELQTYRVFADVNIMQVPAEYVQYMDQKSLKYYAVVPLQKVEGKKVGSIIFYFADMLGSEGEYDQFIKKIVDLILLIVAYEEKQREIYRLAYIDLSTGMINHHGFMEYVESCQIVGGELQFIEVTEFSRIIEAYGREKGEQLLRAIYERMLQIMDQTKVYIGRYTSTSISLFIPQQLVEDGAIDKLLHFLVAEPYVMDGIEMYITLKSGGVMISEDMQLHDAIRFADSALFDARDYSGTCAVYYNHEKRAQLTNELSILMQLVQAVKNKEITAYLQPKVELRKRRITSMEALARWISPTLGFVSPAEFIPLAEKAGLIREIDLQIIESVLQWFQKRQYEGKRIVPIAVNISPGHFYHPHFVEELQQLIQKYYADPNYLIIEITESLGLVDIGRAQKIIQRLNNIGLKTSVDDFGMGYSSLSYLQKLMFTELKIDRNFTSRIHEVGTLAIVRSLIQIAHNLEMDVVAEGVETEEQGYVLYENGCKGAQGYLFYRPMSFEEIEQKKILD